MVTRGIAVELALTIAQAAEHGQVIAPRALVLCDTEFQGCHRLDQCGTVQLTSIDHQLFAVVDLQGMSHIGNVHELTGYPQGRGLSISLAQHLADLHAVSPLEGHLRHR